MLKKIIIIILVSVLLPLNAQNKKDKVLLTIDKEAVYASEFLHVYNKNKDVVTEENKKDINEYLELFINYKLKLKEAFDLKLDTIPSYVKEFGKYKKQLIEPYLKDRKVTDKLVKQAYDRMTEEVKASHILIMVKAHASPKDTLDAYNKLLDARKEILEGATFEVVAKKYSQDPSVKDNAGSLGYFTAFSMVYPFENAAFSTEINEISMPFKTNFGYHIVKILDKRKSKGEVKVAHLMIKDDKNKPNYAKKQINDIYQKFKQGEKFDFLVKKYSDDKNSAKKGGALRRFSQGKMIQPFADISFGLKKEEVSEPFKTQYGWHFVKLLEKYPIASYDKLKESLTKKIEKSERSVLAGKSVANRLKKEYNVTVNKQTLATVLNATKDTKLTDATFLNIKEVKYTAKDLKKYFDTYSSKDYKDFIDEKVIDYYKANLENEKPEFAATVREYRDGLLLFDLLQQKIWTKAEKDTIGLQDFFAKNNSNYIWKERVDVVIASCTKKEHATKVQQLLNDNKTTDEIKDLVNQGAVINVLFKTGVFEVDSKKLPANFIAKKGVSNIIVEDDKHFTVINTLAILPTSPKILDETKGKVISDYQDYLEKVWIKDLRKNYTVKVNKKTLKKLVKKYK